MTNRKATKAQRELQAQAGIAADLNMLKTRPLMVASADIDSLQMMSQFGPVPGVKITLHMQNGDTHPPFILDPLAAISFIASITSALAGAAAPTPPAPSQEGTPDPATVPTTETSSGLIIPG